MREQERDILYMDRVRLHIERVRESEKELRRAFVSGLFKAVLPKLEKDFGEVKEATTEDDEVKSLFFATPIGDPFTTLPGQLVDCLALSLDIVLRNRGVTLDRRKVILENFRRISQEIFGVESFLK